MRQVTCAACQAPVPMNEAFSVADRSLCQNCLEKFLAESDKPSGKLGEITRLIDPTICVHCAADGGETEWGHVAGMPACTTCESFFRNRPYPTWLKLSLVGFLLVAVAAFIYNLRFFMAHIDIIHGQHAMQERRLDEAVEYYASAAKRLPEIPELAVLPNLFHAQQLTLEEKPDEALALIQKTRPYVPSELSRQLRMIELNAEIGLAFDRRDYDTFLKFSQELLRLEPDNAATMGSVASAYACKYADSGDPQFRDLAIESLEKAKTMAGPDHEEFKEYENRLQHRLATREIITRKQFRQRFPNGWKSEGGK